MRDARRRTIRTTVQAAISAASVLLVAIPVISTVLGEHMTAEVYAGYAAVAGAITTGATLITRVMSLPAVIGWIDTYLPWLSASAPVATDESAAELSPPTTEVVGTAD
ncbi:hypothetical protein AB0J80_36120 [Actinoplanes sp. NPDC049548]|uniref:hypothetical protein n=1 Tax=Actinoplanes sp. NPDC049548 TaxID=3155152 RepID=UPI00341EB555